MKMHRSDQRKDKWRDLTEDELAELQAQRRIPPGKVTDTMLLAYRLAREDIEMNQPEVRDASGTVPRHTRRIPSIQGESESALFGMTRTPANDQPMLGRGPEAMAYLARSSGSRMRTRGPIQRKEANDATDATLGEMNIEATSSGEALPEEIRAKMEAALGMDFSGVRIHVGPQAASIGALAFTRGTDIFFAPGQYQPWSQRGQELLGHELTHVVQQAEGRAKATSNIAGTSMSNDVGLEREADERGRQAAQVSTSRSENHKRNPTSSRTDRSTYGRTNRTMSRTPLAENTAQTRHSHRAELIQRKSQQQTTAHGVWLVSNPAKYKSTIVTKLLINTRVKIIDHGAGRSFNKTNKSYQWVRVEVTGPTSHGLKGWVMRSLIAPSERARARAAFLSYPTLKPSTGWAFGKDGTQTTSVSSLTQLGMASIFNYDVAILTGDLLKKIKEDPGMIAFEKDIVSKARKSTDYGVKDFYQSDVKVVQFGGKRWSNPNEDWGSIENNPALHKETWQVATRDLTWALRHATVKYWVEVSKSGGMRIEYRLNDRLDLSGQKGRSPAYSNISNFLGFFYHDVAGGNENLQTRATWEQTIEPSTQQAK